MKNDTDIKGIHVLALFPDSKAGKAGVQIGDIILAVDGVAVYSLEEYVAQARQRKGPMVLDIMRNNSLKEIVIPG